jgi:putative ABC transport system permease protein
MSDAKHTRWFRRLLRLLPADFQADYARDMERTFAAQHREAARERGLWRLWLDTVVDLLRTAPRQHAAQAAQDAAYALRMFGVAPGFTAVAVLTLAVGIGANTAVFSIVDAVLLRPLPYPDPNRLVRIFETRVRDGLLHNAASGPNALDWQQLSTAFSGMTAYRQRSLNVSGRGEPIYVDGARAAANFFDVLGVTVARGRTFTAEEDRQAAPVAVITDGFWRSQLAGDSSVVGRQIDLDGEPYTIVGVLPPAFAFHMRADVWIPLGLHPGTASSRGSHNLQVLARVADGRTIEDAQAELAGIAARLERLYPETNRGWSVRTVPLHDSIVEDVRPLTVLVFGAVGVVLLVACANIGSMLIARAAGRRQEFAVRLALGANRTRLVRQLLTESTVLAALGGTLGAALAAVLVNGARQFNGVSMPRLADAGINGTVLAVTATLTLATGFAFGLAPAMHVGRWELGGGLKAAGRGDTAHRARRRLQWFLIMGQVALAVILLSGAGLMTRTLWQLGHVDPGFDARGILAIDLSLSDATYPTDAAAATYFARLVAGVRAHGGIEEAALVSDPPLLGGDGHWENGFHIVGRPPKPAGEMDFAYLRWATPAYFRMLRVPVRSGRMFTEDDTRGRALVLVVNAAFASKFFPGQDAIGQEIVLSWRDPVPRRIVGVVGDLRQTALERGAEPQMYVPYYQSPIGYGTLLVSGRADEAAIAFSVREAVRAVDAQQPLFNVRGLADDVAAYLAPRQVAMQTLMVFATIALALALVGIYAVLSYQVRERTREFGVRMALGATAANILRMVVRDGMAPALAGVLLGLGGAALLTRVLASLLFETEPLDPITFAGTAGVLLTAALIACCVPARRATRVDPSTALRAE